MKINFQDQYSNKKKSSLKSKNKQLQTANSDFVPYGYAVNPNNFTENRKNSQFIRNQPAYPIIEKRSIDSDIEFLLSSSVEEMNTPKNFKNTELTNRYNTDIKFLPNTENRKSIQEDLRRESMKNEDNSKSSNRILDENYLKTIQSIYNEETPVNFMREKVEITKILEEKDQTIIEILHNMPNYYSTLKQEYLNLKNKFEKVAQDYKEQCKLNTEYSEKINKLIKEGKEKSQMILTLTGENEGYKNKQSILDLFKEETSGYIEILKLDSEKKDKEIDQLIKENGELKCREGKRIYEKDLHEREMQSFKQEHTRLQAQKELIKQDMSSLSDFVSKTFEEITNSGITEKIVELSSENSKLLNYFYFFNKSVPAMKILKMFFEDFSIQLKKFQNFNREITKGNEHKIEMLNKKVNKLEILVEEELKLVLENTNKIKEEISRVEIQLQKLRVLSQQDNGRNELLKMVTSQRNELETQRMLYERKINDLTKKIEEQEDMWDVFE